MEISVGQSEGGHKRYQRTYLACRNCRQRKVRCDLGDPLKPLLVCARCRRERRACVFEAKKRRSVDSLVVANNDEPGATEDMLGNLNYSTGSVESAKSPKHFSTMNGALAFLANAAGRMAADEKKDEGVDTNHAPVGHSDTSHSLTPAETPRNEDKIPLTMLSLVPPYMNNGGDPYSSSPSVRARSRNSLFGEKKPRNDKNGLFRNNPADPIRPDHVARSYSLPVGLNNYQYANFASTPPLLKQESIPGEQFPVPVSSSLHVVATDRNQAEGYPRTNLRANLSDAQINKAASLEDIEYIGELGILTASEADYFIRMYFSTLHPFFPHIPKFLHLPKVLSGYPLLLCAILTISARYHPLESSSADETRRNIEVHDRLWLQVQGMISRTVWAEASTRSIGTVFAFLLLTEWNPRAIHWRSSDYANKAEDMTDTRDSDSIATDFPMNSGPEPAGLGAMRRSYRMAWMLIGSAVRLAQDMAFMEISSCTFLATHIAEINSVMNMKRRSMLSHSLAEVDMLTYNISEAEMELQEEKEYNVNNKYRNQTKGLDYQPLPFTEVQRAQIELLQIISLGHESLYGYKAQLGCLSQRQNLAILNIMNPMIKNWGVKYRNLLIPTRSKNIHEIQNNEVKNLSGPALERVHQLVWNESFIFDFNYTKLYIFSLALSPSPESNGDLKEGKIALKLDEISKSAKYIELAFNSANEILQVAHRVHKLQMLKYMPVRWVTKVVRAVAFIVKCYLTITAHKSAEAMDRAPSSSEDFDSTVLSLSLISVDQIVKSIYDAAVTLRDCSPDELHLCSSYSKILFYLYSEMKQSNSRSVNELNPISSDPQQSPPQQSLALNDIKAESEINEPKEVRISPPDNITEMGFVPENDLMDWFINNRDMGGLDFVGPWTELIEQQLESGNFEF